MISILAYLPLLMTSVTAASLRINHTTPLIEPTATPNDNRTKIFMDPELWLNTSEIIKYHGYPVEEHTVTTEDGYILTIQRIPRGNKEYRSIKRYPIILQHGLLAASDSWVINTPENNLAYRLSDAGYDVWLANSRGNSYGKGHVSLTTRSRYFWRFSFHEMGKYDMPATIDYILKITGSKQVHYLGYSMGSSILLVTLSTRPEYNSKIRSAMLLAPAMMSHHVFSPLHYVQILSPVLRHYDDYEFAFFFPLMRYLLTRSTQACLSKEDPEQCLVGTYITAGYTDPANVNMSRIPVYVAHFPDTSSVRNVLHATQMKGKPFQMYDYGRCRNPKFYKELNPPRYNLRRVTVPIAVFWSESDPVVTILDVSILLTTLPNIVLDYKVPVEKFNHQDFVQSTIANKVLYDKVLETLNNQTKKKRKRMLLKKLR